MPEPAVPKPEPTPLTQSADSQPSPAPAGDPLAEAKKEAADAYDRYLRAVADLENYRRRAMREKDELRQFAAGRVLEDLIPVVDHLALAVAAGQQPNADVKSLVGGVSQVLQQFKAALSAHGLKEVNPAGQPFDPHQHEAISHQPSSEVAAESVLTVVRPGYLLNSRLLRPAAVVVSSGPAGGGKSG
jgi:molecular chaperone GrpE